MKVVKTIIGDFTFDRAQKLRKLVYSLNYTQNFVFEEIKLNTDFGVQIVEYLETQFDLKSEDE